MDEGVCTHTVIGGCVMRDGPDRPGPNTIHGALMVIIARTRFMAQRPQ